MSFCDYFNDVNYVFILKEVAVNLGLVPFIDMYTDPDAINQLIIKMVNTEELIFEI
jgi:hypothetical protein